ncbi:MAG: CpaD family pilus assembly protein [Proteobacteria bacterium]|nr:CpaD family pilus assembly protein [Pseudomonadota bacterium]
MQKQIFMKSAPVASLTAMLFALAACAPFSFEEGGFTETATPQSASLNKQINVEKVSPTVIVEFGQGRAGLSDLEKGKILGFIQAQQIGFGQEVEVELPSFSGNGGLNERRYGELAGFLQDRGFEVTPKTTQESGQNSLRVYFVKYIATIDPDCENGWYRPRGLGYENLPLPNMGCSTASALAGMLANPKDLVDPASADAAIGERAAKSVETYRKGSTSSGSGTSGGGNQ